MAIIQLQKIAEDVILDMGQTDDIDDEMVKKFIQKAIRRINRTFKLAGIDAGITQADEYCDIEFADEYMQIIPDLITLQAECLISKRRYYDAVSKGIKIKSGSDSVDTTSSFGGHEVLSSSFCDELKDALKSFLDEVGTDALINGGGDVIWYGEQREFWKNEDYNNDRKNFKSPFDDGTERD